MIVAVAGRRIDASDAPVTRFPLKKADEVKAKIKALLISLKPTVLVSSGACGADLLAMEAAGSLNIQRSMVLPFDQSLFKTTSVTDRPGDWGKLYDEICKEVADEEGILVLNYDKNDKEIYRKANIDILKRAKELAGNLHSKDMVAIIVWEGKPKDEDDTTAHFRNEAEKNGFQVKEIITL